MLHNKMLTTAKEQVLHTDTIRDSFGEVYYNYLNHISLKMWLNTPVNYTRFKT